MSQDRAADAARLRRELTANPRDRVAWHNLAAAEGDLGRAAEAEEAARRALALGIAAPETRLVLARALQDQGRLEEAESMFEQALLLRPSYAVAHRDLAQLRWMRTGDAGAALAALDRAISAAPGEVELLLIRSIVLEFTGNVGSALTSAEEGLARAPRDIHFLRQTAHLHAERGDAERAVVLARRAAELAAADPGVEVTLCEALLASGRIGEAEAAAAQLCASQPLDQHGIALRATAWRMLGNRRYHALYDYGSLVASCTLEAPPGWSSLETFLKALAAELEGLHRFRTHPFQQSVRGGSQLPLNAAEFDRPLIRALFAGIEAAVNRHLSALGGGTDPFRTRNTGRMVVTGAWSVRLDSGGHHTDHVHSRGWLSSAFYVSVPSSISRSDAGYSQRAGWLRLGRPGIATKPPLAPDFYVKPQAGSLVLFPAYMWHGVERFESEEPRISVAFDALPA